MPRLLIFAPCERVILGQGDNSASLIVIIQDMQFVAPQQVDALPKDAGAAVRLALYSQWHRTAGDEGKTFQQRIVFARANDEATIFDATTDFQMTENSHRIIANIPVLPFLEPGQYEFRVSIKEKRDEAWTKPFLNYPVNISVIMQPQLQ